MQRQAPTWCQKGACADGVSWKEVGGGTKQYTVGLPCSDSFSSLMRQQRTDFRPRGQHSIRIDDH